MDKVRIYYDAFARTLTVWLDEPTKEDVCEEADDDTVFMKDAAGRIIGFEKLNVDFGPDAAGPAVELVNVAVPSR